MIELSYYTRLEPRPRANDFSGSLAAEIRDPVWFLTRQWQMGEFTAEDAGSLAFVEYSAKAGKFVRWSRGEGLPDVPVRQDAPLETQTLREPFTPDFATQVELFHDFADFLREETGSAPAAQTLIEGFGTVLRYGIEKATEPEPNVLNPVDAATKRFLGVCAGRALNGCELLKLGKGIAGGTDTVPASVTTNPTEIAQIEAALARLVERVTEVFGDVGTADPTTWNPRRLEYSLRAVAENPSGQGNVTLAAYPDSDGEYDWYSFDMIARDAGAVEDAPTPSTGLVIPARVRFPGMAASRFWAFEEHTLAIPDVLATGTDDLLKLLITDFMLIHSNDWFVLPFEQKVGTIAQIDWLLVEDVFGTKTVVLRADRGEVKTGANRWTMYGTSDFGAGDDALSDYFIVPPTPGVTMQLGTVLEDVRFGRDETANMAWGIEHLTTSPIGEPRTGTQRDGDIDAARRIQPPPTGSGLPLRYQIENELPAYWVPLLPRVEAPPNPSIVLQRGQAEKAVSDTAVAPVPAISKILNPDLPVDGPYLIDEEEVPREGLRVERVVCRARWIDGSTHLWVQRRRKIGAGESQSGLRFDQALPNQD